MANDKTLDRGRLLLRAVRGTDITVFYQDAELKYVWMENAPEGWDVDAIVDKKDSDILPATAAEMVTNAKKDVLETGQNTRITVHLETEDEPRWFDLWIDPDCDDDGTPQGVLCFSVEITERKRREDNLQRLLLEVSHRSRNMLAIVKSIASQTMKSTQSPSDFIRRFNDRVQSIAHSLDVVTKRDWDGATFHELIEGQVRPFQPNGRTINISGLNPILDPNASLHIGLALQELASNAVRHGVWTQSSGHVDIEIAFDSAQVKKPRSQRAIIMRWRETADTTDISPPDDVFASRLIGEIVPMALGGASQMHARDGSVVYELTVPKNNFR
ncbi:MAG: HWE histidine kinase domain-containing protein [Pseudomonadota bacterium]